MTKKVKKQSEKNFVINSESAKGLFLDQQHENDLATAVQKEFSGGAQKIVLTENILNSGKQLVIKGYVPRGATSANSPFTYVTEDGKKLCGDIRKYFGLPTYNKQRGESSKKTFADVLISSFEALAKLTVTAKDEFILKAIKDAADTAEKEYNKRAKEERIAQLEKELARLRG